MGGSFRYELGKAEADVDAGVGAGAVRLEASRRWARGVETNQGSLG